VIASDQVGKDEPGGGGAPADGAVRDQLLAAVEVDRREYAAELRGGAERSVVAVQAVDGLVDGRGHMAGAAARFLAA
jgi:hypothetical protein